MGLRVAAVALALCTALAACGSEPDGATNPPRTASDGAVSPAAGGAKAVAATDAPFQAVVNGALNATVEQGTAIAGAKYGRFHFSLSGRIEGSPGPLLISLARSDPAAPVPGTYALGGTDGFRGNVELYPGPDRDFTIQEGELVITAVRGDVFTGRFTFIAKETAEEYGSESPTITVEGNFRTSPK